MEETKTIQIPKGWVVDKEKSTESNIVLVEAKDVPMRWRDNEDNLISGYWIDSMSVLVYEEDLSNDYANHNIFVTEKQAKSALAMARISQIMENDKRFGGVVTDEEWNDYQLNKYFITRKNNNISKYQTIVQAARYCNNEYHFLAFHTPEQRELFLEENEDLVKLYLMID